MKQKKIRLYSFHQAGTNRCLNICSQRDEKNLVFFNDARLPSRTNTSVFKNCDFNLKDIRLRETHNTHKHKYLEAQ